MKIAIVSDSLAHLAFEEMLDLAVELGVTGIEMNTGNWSAAPHLDLERLLGDGEARRRFLDAFARRGLELIALNANGNPLHPTDGARQSAVVRATLRLAGLLGVRTVCLMSGLPSGGSDDRTPNLIVSSRSPETGDILAWQWREKLLPYWRELVVRAAGHGVDRLCVELHGNQLVYNVPSLLRLREEIGETVGANLDPSHLIWMGADPLAAVDALGEAVFHVHAKDTYLNPAKRATTGLLENGPLSEVAARSWSYVTLGYGHGASWWREFCYRLRMVGYDGWLAIEHEDVLLSRVEGVRRSVELLAAAMPEEAADFVPQAI